MHCIAHRFEKHSSSGQVLDKTILLHMCIETVQLQSYVRLTLPGGLKSDMGEEKTCCSLNILVDFIIRCSKQT